MVDTLTYPMVEVVARSYLISRIPGLKVGTKAPKPIGRFVRLDTSGGADQTVVTSRRILIVQCYDKDQVSAGKLAEQCFAVLKSATRDPTNRAIRKVTTVGAPSNFPDLEAGLERYQFTVELLLRAQLS